MYKVIAGMSLLLSVQSAVRLGLYSFRVYGCGFLKPQTLNLKSLGLRRLKTQNTPPNTPVAYT